MLHHLVHGAAGQRRPHVVEADVEDRVSALELLQVAAGDVVLLEDDDGAAGLGQQDGVHEPGNAGPDDEDVGSHA